MIESTSTILNKDNLTLRFSEVIDRISMAVSSQGGFVHVSDDIRMVVEIFGFSELTIRTIVIHIKEITDDAAIELNPDDLWNVALTIEKALDDITLMRV